MPSSVDLRSIDVSQFKHWRSPGGEVLLINADCLKAMSVLSGVTAIVTDPPYGLEFMGKEWDKLGAVIGEQDADTPGWTNGSGEFVAGAKGPFGGSGKRVRYGASVASMQEWHYRWAVEALRVAKPGAHLLAFGGTRTFHRLTCALEDAGWEIRDCIMWVYGSGFPKSLDVSKAIDKADGAEREVVGTTRGGVKPGGKFGADGVRFMPEAEKYHDVTSPATPNAEQWQGWGTALKPAWEPIIVARKPLQGTVAANVQKFGTGALNIDGCRIQTGDKLTCEHDGGTGNRENWRTGNRAGVHYVTGSDTGRWPANVVWSHVSLPVMRLADTIPLETAAFIRGYFHGHANLQAMRQREGNHAVQVAFGATVLQPEMQGFCSKDDANKRQGGSFLPGVRQGVSDVQVLAERRTQEVLQSEVQGSCAEETDGREVAAFREETHEEIPRDDVSQSNRENRIGRRSSPLEGRANSSQRICGSSHSNSPESSDERGPSNEAESGIHPGAQADGSDKDRPPINEVRHRASPGREPLEQSGREPSRHVKPETQPPASTTGEGSLAACGRERPLEVLACDVPAEWFGYFKFTGEDLGCRPVGMERVKAITGGAKPHEANGTIYGGGRGIPPQERKHYSDADGMETVEKWDCHPDCPSRSFPTNAGGRWGKHNGQHPDSMFFGEGRSRTDDIKSSAERFIGECGSASRFFYCAKASRSERGEGNTHPTVKPLALMRYLIRLVKQPTTNLILDPFGGSGTTVVACIQEGVPCIVIERDPAYFDMAVARCEKECARPVQGLLFAGDNQ